MKKLMIILMMLSVIVFGGEIEFDGGYIKTAKGSYVEVKVKNASSAKIVYDGIGIMQVMNMPKTYSSTYAYTNEVG